MTDRSGTRTGVEALRPSTSALMVAEPRDTPVTVVVATPLASVTSVAGFTVATFVFELVKVTVMPGCGVPFSLTVAIAVVVSPFRSLLSGSNRTVMFSAGG